jgi:membrane dipeptidase
MTSQARVPIFDCHNDALLRLYRRGGTDGPWAFLMGEEKGHLDLPKATQGGFAGGLFAVFVPSARRSDRPPDEASAANPAPPPASPIDLASAQSVARRHQSNRSMQFAMLRDNTTVLPN